MPTTPFDTTTAQVISLTAGGPRVDSGRTLAGMRQELQRALGNRTGEIDPVDLTRWVNDGYYEVIGMLDEQEFKGSFSFATVAGQAQYYIPSADLKISAASYNEDDEHTLLAKMTDVGSWRLIEDIPAGVDVDPTHIFVQASSAGTLLVLHPVPYRVLSISVDYAARPLPLSHDLDSPLLEPSLHRAVFEFAKSAAHADLREYDFAGQAQNRAVGLVRTKLDRRATQKENVVSRVRVIRDASQLQRRMT